MRSNHPSDIYCLDADALIDIWRCYPQALRKISRYAKKGTVVIVEGVYREIYRQTDHLKHTVRTWLSNYSAVIKLDTDYFHAELSRIEATYGQEIIIGKQQRKGFWASRSGKRAADGQVVTVCKVKNYIAVSNDEAIQNACHIENIPCIGWQEFYRRMNEGFTDQKVLFE